MPLTITQHSSDARSYVTRRVAGETLIVPVTSSTADLEAIFLLNDTGARIWDLLREPITRERIADVLAAEFAIAREAALDDVQAFLAELDTRGLIQTAGGNPR